MIAFTDIVGMDLAKQALMLLAVDPSLGGVVIPSTVGSGKSTLARAFADILPEGTPFVELPLNVTEDRLIGGVDLEATLASGQRVVQHGVLSKAHKGVLYVDSLSLLDSSAVSHIMDAMSRGAVIVEREGLSEVHPADFMLVGTYDPSDGEVRMGLLDRIGIIVPFTPVNDYRARKQIVSLVMGTRNEEDTQDELRMLRGIIGAAREQLHHVSITNEQIKGLIQTAISLGVEGNRVDIFAIRAALANAALGQRTEVDDEDLKLAVKLVLVPRATRMPEREPSEEEMQQEEPPPPEEQPEQEGEDENAPPDETDSDADEEQEETPDMIEELMMDAIETDLPENILNISLASKKKAKSGSRGEALNNKRGRFVRSQPGEIKSGKVALIPTLISAAPWQAARKAEKAKKGIKTGALVISTDDVKIKRFRDKSGTLFIFMVDASGSMALNRMRQAKGAVASLLQNAYVHRDQVSLISFRGKQAQVLLPPSQSVDRAKRELDVLPTGGGTPLASALLTGWETAKQARTKGITQIMFVMITDGRGNIPLAAAVDPAAAKAPKEELEKEVEALALSIQSDGIASIVVDTQMNYLSRGEAPKLAQKLGGRYFYLPNAKAEQIVEAALS
ncbi:magnesium chelatase ATPase subunit D [Chlorobaculum parvum NCIB 8327]|uniref:Magnesium-chelatase 67 kDa subunit n=1 Tax=Chlorobaculum parvum (strain DSM 263 / NCIMB 8327) TaxID=517417 RepID=BCHD_CHLP8|nr:magnesium chelatase ATPase subunit D [Chlorobaculum parvum]O50313.1 RecName: Full=Magnesium-chelatase 67 kDa subunit; Short=Mg-chelatase subunit D; AltName: Full=Mg-protoporphyrin IX chelatase [Chlorobaculum parvum NCIB 8327]ACF11145.1 magnesium chelatase ATPase subunit D [Chlorobaculum parvum NCIB 8327]CAB06300.1 Mg-protoporphyrin IX chelatase, 67 kDa subunit [Prosthecochloris vibrioformis]